MVILLSGVIFINPVSSIHSFAFAAFPKAAFGTKLASQLKPIIIPPLDKEETFKNERRL
jgi:hypothetical protein